MKHALSSMVVSVCLSALLGCAGDSSAESPSVESLYVVLNQGIYTDNGIGTRKQTKIISSQADYAMELLNYSSAKPASVDFDKGRVLLVDMGVRNTGGYSVGVASVDVAENWVVACRTGQAGVRLRCDSSSIESLAVRFHSQSERDPGVGESEDNQLLGLAMPRWREASAKSWYAATRIEVGPGVAQCPGYADEQD
jgi:hypothetical protein